MREKASGLNSTDDMLNRKKSRKVLIVLARCLSPEKIHNILTVTNDISLLFFFLAPVLANKLPARFHLTVIRGSLRVEKRRETISHAGTDPHHSIPS